MSNLQLTAKLEANGENIRIALSLVEFSEDNNVIIYSPALDLSGYGITEEEAKRSFEVALEEFIRYTTTQKTLDTVLRSLGWSIRGPKSKPTYNPPKDSEMIVSNPLYSDIVNNKAYKVSTKEVVFSL